MQKTLNNLFNGYFTGTLERGELEGLVYQYLIHNQEKTCLNHWKHDDYEDFISWFYPRLRLAIESYNDTGSSFEAFFTKFIHISAKEYNVRSVINNVTEYCAWSARVPEMYVHEEPPVYKVNEINKVFTNLVIEKGRKNTRRILALILKCYYYVSDDFAEKIAPLIGMEIDELKNMLERIKKIRQEKDDNYYYFKERIYRQFYKCIIYEKRLTIVKENTTAYNKLKTKMEKARITLERMRKRLSFIRMEATNKQIAEVIGTSKGTVDASLSRLKIKWEKLAKNSDLN
ncbi:MAG: hypothetical protein FWD24_06125 [Treponema sp.]|nr:hypothetical protein [Treponema sp.]